MRAEQAEAEVATLRSKLRDKEVYWSEEAARLMAEVARLTALVAQSGWEPIATAPKDRSRVMLWNGYRRCIGWFVPEGWHRQNIIGEPLGPRDIDPDFAWMPLPAPPEGPTR